MTNAGEGCDVALVGGGVAGASVLIRLAAAGRLPSGSSVVLVDPHGETGGGGAYHARVHRALLLNDPIAQLDRTGLGFGRWLSERSVGLVAELRADDDPRVVAWCGDHGPALARGEVAGLFAPRHLFGRFLREQFADAARRLADAGVRTRVITDTARDVRPRPGGWDVDLAGHGVLSAGAVVLGTGGPVGPVAVDHPRWFRGTPGLDLTAVERAVIAAPSSRLLILGTAASAVEMVHCIAAAPALAGAVGEIVAVSPGGRFPDGVPSGRSGTVVAARLESLREPSALAVIEALEDDVRTARAGGYTVPDAYAAVHGTFISIFTQLPAVQKKQFVDRFSRRYLTALRKTSPIYATSARRLAEAGRLVELAGRVESAAVVDDVFEVHLGDGRTVRGDAVLDCRGFGSLTGDGLLSAMLGAGTVVANDSGRGLLVDERLEAAPGLAVLGPLLAGTATATDHIWHLEDIPRIYGYADRIAGTLGERVRAARRGAGATV